MSWNAQELDPEYPFDLFAADFTLSHDHTALLVIDMQIEYLNIAADAPVALKYPEIRAYFNARMDEIVMPNTIALIHAFRERFQQLPDSLPTRPRRSSSVRSRGKTSPVRDRERLRLVIEQVSRGLLIPGGSKLS